jgi:carboxyl-terminal processing protease
MTSSVNETNSFARISQRALRSAHIVRVCACAFASAFSIGSAHAQSKEQSPYYKLEAFTRALAHIEQSYVDVPDGERLMRGAIRGMVEELDPHSVYLDRDELQILEDDAEGRYAGIGTEIDVRDGWLTVSAVLDGSPAQRAGLKPGDRFLLIDGVPARDMPLLEAIGRMRGAPGTRVRVALRRNSVEDAIERELTREMIAIRAVDARVLEDAIVVMRLRVFQETTASELHRALEQSAAACAPHGGIRGMVIDLRDNPGGLVAAAVDVADEFLADGTIVQTRGRGDRVLQTQAATRAGTQPDYPIVLLVNARTASAAEILAGALRDHDRAVVVGERTVGKGSVQNIIGLPDGSAIKLTTARYYTPSGRAIQARGIEPDVAVVASSDARSALDAPLREADLDRHLSPADMLEPTAASSRRAPRGEQDVATPFANDEQARTAVQVLRALIAAKKKG